MTKTAPQSDRTWRWLTFPVLAAFVFGVLFASFIDHPDSDFAVVVRILAIVLSAGCLAHIVGRYIILPRRLRARRLQAGVVDEEAYGRRAGL